MNEHINSALPPNFNPAGPAAVRNDAAHRDASMKRLAERKGMAASWRLYICLGYIFMILAVLNVVVGIVAVVFAYGVKSDDSELEGEV